jgi:hypothetical protein
VTFCNIVNQLLDQNGFAYSGTAKKTNLTTLCIRLNKINYFNTCKKYFTRC